MRGERMWGDGGASSAQGWARLQIGSRARGGAHGEHVKHVCDAGGVAKLSGWLNADAYCRESNGGHTMRDEVRARRREGGGRPRCKQGAGERARLQIRGRARGGAHIEHVLHVRDAVEVSKLSGWLNADARCRELKGGHAVRDEGAGQRTGTAAGQRTGTAAAARRASGEGSCRCARGGGALGMHTTRPTPHANLSPHP